MTNQINHISFNSEQPHCGIERVYFLDTTLRDGEQSPGSTMILDEKLEIARHLEAIGIDRVEAGFPAASRGDLLAVREIAHALPRTQVAGLARVYQSKTDGSFPDITAVYEALRDAPCKPIVHAFISTSPIQIKAKFPGKTLDDVIELAVSGIKYARRLFDSAGKKVTIEFSPEDGARTPKEDLLRVVNAITAAGADVVNIPDTVGYMTPWEYAEHIKHIYESVPAFRDGSAILSVHCHNDLGMATANALAAVQFGGARQIEGTFTGIAERAGMTALEQVIMAMKTRKDIFGEAAGHINTEALYGACHRISAIIENPLPRHQPIVGDNAFSHESGIHAHGEIGGMKNGVANVYEIMNAESVGWQGDKFVLGKHAGWHQVSHKLATLGYHDIDERQARAILERIKTHADTKKSVYDHEVDEIMIDLGIARPLERYKIVTWGLASGSEGCEAWVYMTGQQTKQHKVFGKGTGSIDAALHAISNATGIVRELVNYAIWPLARGSEAKGKVSISILDNIFNGTSKVHRGVAIHRDTLYASMQAYVNALNRMAMYRALKSNT
ncbi:MAG TPA: 2-isopropylmalate synthase [Candidatus Nanoarchaeia archaeon]|nr:2-isopropylmalate synthase [Candidatus Nanoarchaeia archaeon]